MRPSPGRGRIRGGEGGPRGGGHNLTRQKKKKEENFFIRSFSLFLKVSMLMYCPLPNFHPL